MTIRRTKGPFADITNINFKKKTTRPLENVFATTRAIYVYETTEPIVTSSTTNPSPLGNTEFPSQEKVSSSRNFEIFTTSRESATTHHFFKIRHRHR